ncbi:SOS response-associated peptidase [Ectothiorhodospira variabilis]|uniref:SOS response-associated peptidase n=1 Tax=Ectothiorhodospira variabilis TaxID=505694 RepID=UPI001EFA38F0|nr:SOS response-associated peptidase [Ectothiorhodospira variabilis]MCG5493832.1 SOS response-associated peptidase [Ectothiorhodospira variabilis]MCG5504031.1 SOS response-associated peptidase [Ectothiorhodospira variabilis]MCG5507186.1 SOS response-associated peptidase [Ectothiorhodospira variabilis]
MCGRYALHTACSLIAQRYLDLELTEDNFEPRFNVAPGTLIPVIRMTPDGLPSLDQCLWGFRPAWAGDDAPRPINARAEKVAVSRYFREAFAHRRCLVPANGWYEWQGSGREKQPFYVTLMQQAENEALFFAGIWEPSADNGPDGCAIITEPARPPLSQIHPRQPVVLDPSCLSAWLDPAITERQSIRQWMRRLAPERLTCHPVSQRVNHASHEGMDLIEPVP